jgi:excinuclease ABC subunit B
MTARATLSFFGEDLVPNSTVPPGRNRDTFDKRVYANSHYVTPKPTMNQAVIGVKRTADAAINWSAKTALLELQRLERCN